MDFIEIATRSAAPFSEKKLVYVHYVDAHATEMIELDEFPCIEVKLILGHVSFPRAIAERRMCAFLNRQKTMDLLCKTPLMQGD